MEWILWNWEHKQRCPPPVTFAGNLSQFENITTTAHHRSEWTMRQLALPGGGLWLCVSWTPLPVKLELLTPCAYSQLTPSGVHVQWAAPSHTQYVSLLTLSSSQPARRTLLVLNNPREWAFRGGSIFWINLLFIRLTPDVMELTAIQEVVKLASNWSFHTMDNAHFSGWGCGNIKSSGNI